MGFCNCVLGWRCAGRSGYGEDLAFVGERCRAVFWREIAGATGGFGAFRGRCLVAGTRRQAPPARFLNFIHFLSGQQYLFPFFIHHCADEYKGASSFLPPSMKQDSPLAA